MRRFLCLKTLPTIQPVFFAGFTYQLVEECRHGNSHYLRMRAANGYDLPCDPADFAEIPPEEELFQNSAGQSDLPLEVIYRNHALN